MSEEKENHIDITFETPGVFKILSTHFFDWFVSTIFALILLIGTFAIISSLPSYQSALDTRNDTLLASHLYVSDGSSTIPLIDNVDKDNKLSIGEKSQKLDDSLAYFFTVFLKDELNGKGEETYLRFKIDAKKDGTPLFNESGERIFTNPDYDNDYYSFYCDTYKNKALGYLSYNKQYSVSRKTIFWTVSLGIILTFLLSFLIFYLVIPLFFSRGKKTLGMLIIRTALVGKNGFSCSYPRFLCHALFEIIFIITMSIPAFLIPLAISITMIVIRKQDHQSLTDYVVGTYMVSTAQRKVYKNVYEYLEAERRANSSRMIEDKNVKFK